MNQQYNKLIQGIVNIKIIIIIISITVVVIGGIFLWLKRSEDYEFTCNSGFIYPEDKEDCKKAVELKDVSLCGSGSSRHFCAGIVATYKQDRSVCDDEVISYCTCIGIYVANLKDLSICETLEENKLNYGDTISECKDQCYYYNALAIKDRTICDKISDGSHFKETCYKKL